MASNNSKWIYTMSSNSRQKYIKNIIEILAVPVGWVVHLRYKKEYIDPLIWEKLSIRNKIASNKKNSLHKMNCVLNYLYQLHTDGETRWKCIYPFRIGEIVDCYKTGDNDNDIAHFFIKAKNYVKYHPHGTFTEEIRKNIGNDKFGRYYISMGEEFQKDCIANIEESKSAFYEICEAIDVENHFRSYDNKRYRPIFCYIEGLKNKKNTLIKPSYHSKIFKSFYKIDECEPYSLEYSFYFQNPQLINSSIEIYAEKEIFSTPEKAVEKIESRYDDLYYLLTSKILQRDRWTVLQFKTNAQSQTISPGHPVNLDIQILINIKRKIIYRIFDVLSDIGFAIGTGAIMLKTAFGTNKMSWWYWPTGIGYLIWLIFKLIIKLWRG